MADTKASAASAAAPAATPAAAAAAGAGASAAADDSKSPFSSVLNDAALLDQLKEESNAWAATHSLIMGYKNDDVKDAPLLFQAAPVSLLPAPMSREAFDFAYQLAPDFNLLNDRVSRDVEFLCQHLGPVAKVDDFYAHLMHIFQTVTKEGIRQPIALGINRSDYMFQRSADGSVVPLQVEMNTIASSFASLSTITAQLHKHTLARHVPQFYDPQRLPENRALSRLAYSLAAASRLHPHSSQGVSVLMIVQPNEANSADQRQLEYALWQDHKIPLIRRTLAQIHAKAQLSPQTHDLVIEGRTISVAYFRAGYTPRDYTSQTECDAYLTVERSRAIKCPTIGYHLAGSKKIQQVLAAPKVLERFVDADTAARLRRSFAGLYALDGDDAATRAVVAAAIAAPDAYVLKPQREGGGNNLWADELVKVLRTATPTERSAYILMAKITPVQFDAALLRRGVVTHTTCVNELGVYGTFLGDGKRVHHNEASGHLLRTKAVGTNEGGVAAGYAFLDSPYLS